MTELTTTTCCYCKKEPADGEDRFCSKCRDEDACQGLTERLTDAQENFLDDRWAPHRYGERPSYYLDAPAFDDLTLCDIVAARNQVVAGTQRLIELAVGRPVEMRYDLLSDLHHLCDTAGIDWMLAVGSSGAYYEDEITGNG